MFEYGATSDLAALTAAGRAECAAAAAKLAWAARIWQDELESSQPHGFAAASVATALTLSTRAAYSLMHLGDVLATRLPGCRRALETGELDVPRVRVIADRTAAITDLALLAEVERQVLETVLVPGRCVTRGQVQRVTDRVVASTDPAAAIEQRRKADQDRCVVVRPDVEGLAGLWGVLRAQDGVVLDARLREMALAVCGADPRTLDQLRADALTALARGEGAVACECGSPVCPSAAPDLRHGPGPVVQVVVDAAVLAGATDLPGVLARYGIVDPEVVRTLAADARWRRLLTVDGVPVHLGPLLSPGARAELPSALRYRPGAAVAELVRTRDAHCRFPGCTARAASCDLDHVIPFDHDAPARGGRTVAENLACLCRWHHRAKTDDVWRVRMGPDATQHWTGPEGQVLHSVPTGMPPRGGAPTCRSPVMFRQRPPPSPLQAPLDDHPPPPVPARWADDPCSERYLDQELDSLVAGINAERARGRRRAHAGVSAWAAAADDRPPF